MNILQFNVRLAEGGAAGVALDLHQRALQHGFSSRFIYGYGKGGKKASAMMIIHRCLNRRPG